ncbi:RNA polymerase, sigma 54 subunit, RpoN [Ammonifex degensii KC4]|uniref:RNA polymerase, sigma 54 subunit, RpoN n=1 Tax=Ammonifex degensii (strain DSM 10501 / KC4) TaxID=429009 RepID=C9R8T3_AMMDK|nr:RNA polymerase factor sigma-54 [Ammonifex degensii]ACX52712.1 RNA polymerase, sigma 54 subunit, RpoN [Ammonifex degensii KC4]
MVTKADIRLETAQKLAFRPELQQAVAVLQFSTQELWQYVQQQLTENPLLELKEEGEGGEPPEEEASEDSWVDYLCDASDLGLSQQEPASSPEPVPVAPGPSLYEHLLQQLAFLPLNSTERAVAEFLAGNLDQDGYLRLPLAEAASLLGISEEAVARGLKVLQSLEPPGVGARDLRECLLLQLERSHPEDHLARKLVGEHLEELAEGEWAKLVRKLGVSQEELDRAVERIRQLNPRPGSNFGSNWVEYVVPDIVVQEVEGDYEVLLNESVYPRLVINSTYRDLLRHPQLGPEAKTFLQQRLKQALWLIKNLEQRRLTLYRVAVALVEKQRSFFDQGLSGLKPLTLREIAEEIGVHESTVSRAIANKYLQCSRGIFPLRFFFASGVSSSRGQEVAAQAVKWLIKQLIDKEDPAAPLSDQAIARELKRQGIELSRRTVAKYRMEMGIPNAAKRKSQ